MKNVKFICFLFQFFIQFVRAQTLSTNEVWMPLKYVEDIKQNRTLMNKKKFCSPIEAIIIKDGQPHFKTYLGRVAKANFKTEGSNRYEITNVQPNINLMYFSKDSYANCTFTVVHQVDLTLLLIKSPENSSSDTVEFVSPVSTKSAISPSLVEGYLLLSGNHSLIENNRNKNNENISFDLKGNVKSSRWGHYNILAASVLLENRAFRDTRTFLVQLKDRQGNVEERMLLYTEGRKLELYKCSRNKKHRYVLDMGGMITLIGL